MNEGMKGSKGIRCLWCSSI